ncbi:MAG: S8 family serine peptidase [Verrucomicrobiales bacterium]|nr:S8 family serine peptidase [Verrucomicrobiales bacterium]
MNFENVIDAGRLRECIDTGTGKGVRIGILDSGVASDLPELEGSVKGNFDVVQNRGGGIVIEEIPKGYDPIDHGTACAYIIHRNAPDAELYSVRVIGQTHSATTKKLLAAMEFAIDQNWDVLNLSLGNETPTTELCHLADRAYYQDTLIVAAKDNKRHKIGFPAAFSSVVSVDMDFFENPLDFRFHPGRETEIDAFGVYVEAPTSSGKRQSYTGTSFACPHITAIAARLRESFPNLSPFQLKTALAALGKTD